MEPGVDHMNGVTARSRPWRARSRLFDLRRLLVREFRIDQDLPSVEPQVPITVHRLGPADWAGLIGLRPFLTEEVIRLRLANGHRFYGAKVDGRIVHVRVVAVDRVFNGYLDLVIPLSPREVYCYEAYTLPEYRGRRVGPAAGLRVIAEMREAGYERVEAFVYPHNRPAIRANSRQGYRHVGHFGYVEVLGVRRYFYWARGGGFEQVPNRLFVRKRRLVPVEIQGTIW